MLYAVSSVCLPLRTLQAIRRGMRGQYSCDPSDGGEFMRGRGFIRDALPTVESLPHTICYLCRKSKINGLFAPKELRPGNPLPPRCMVCTGDISGEQREIRLAANRRRRTAGTGGSADFGFGIFPKKSAPVPWRD